MGVQQKKVAVHDLEVGMFVSDLDRPWHQTPFPIQGFPIRSQDDIRAVSSHCRWVMVDVAEVRESIELSDSKPIVFGRNAKSRGKGREVLQLPPLNIREPVEYEELTTLKKELKTSRQVLGDIEVALHRLFETIRSDGVADLKPIARLTSKMVSSVIRQPDALLWLSRTRQHDDFLYRHALNTAVWALVCGRQLGLNEGLLNHLGLGCLLSQVGKTALPHDLLARENQLGAEEFTEYKTYVARGVEMLDGSGLSRAVLSIVQGHRERHNGSGFPEGIRGDRIPLLAKVAGLAEFFESLIGPRDESQPMTPAKAVTMLYDMRNIEFQEDLIEVFIQAIGIYPTGSLVELTDGQRGIVVSHSPERRLWPRVMVMTDADHKPLKSAKIIDLARFNEDRDAGEVITVRECLPHGAEDLDPSNYDVTGVESRWNFSRLISG
ncbi:HDIG domain protein [Marinobacter nitratireducens]|uniref:HDIG domain protein n=1 Tax=Marinobacter nitratireducens TaxID=1137280 RepID=A0A072N6P8_9GAMM|nr:HD-GYP domain-containing protein [Marinobacter nitratireducens]KEF32608.1 HDIG domain protein [Marinobacter nitratireducens]TNE98271.1 MAG: HD-GYP domain-containing protein [Gammaproteobacteria bacterium]